MPDLPELLVPAGDMERLRTALTYGADAVYLGGGALNLRAKAKGFSPDELEQAFQLVRKKGKRCYYCLNAFPRQSQLKEAEQQLEWLASLPALPQALIVADPGVVRLARRILPDMQLHLSTQANTCNAESAAFWRDQGVSRINLARELSGPEIKRLARQAQGVELEVFVHGAMCMALSGRCLMSSHLRGRSANLGLCAHPCRYDYQTTALRLEERTRPGRGLWELTEDGEYSAVFSAEDLCLVLHLRWLARHSIAAFKIEGRTKTAGYLAQVADVYRTALDQIHGPQDQNLGRDRLMAELQNTTTRPLSTGFFHGRKLEQPIILAQAPGESERAPILALVGDALGPDAWEVKVRGRWDSSQPFEVLVPGLQRPSIPPADYVLEDEEGTRLDLAHSGVTRILRSNRPEIESGLFLRSINAN